MRRLYLRIYFAVLASLVVFALAAGVLWHTLADPHGGDELATIAGNLLPPAAATPAEQQAALERLARGVRVDLSLYSADGRQLAVIGRPLPPPTRSGWQPAAGGPRWTMQLADGRWLVARDPRSRRGPAFGLFALAL